MKTQTGRSLHWHTTVFQPLIRWKYGVAVGVVAAFLVGFCLSAASLGHTLLPICPAVLCVGLPGWMNVSFAVGASLGYWFFWGTAGVQAMVWIAGALVVGTLLNAQKKWLPLLLACIGALIVALTGLGFALWRGMQIYPGLYFLQIGVAFATVLLAKEMTEQITAVTAALALGILTLALAQIAPTRYLNLGVAFAAMVSLTVSFPAAAMTGLALDLAGAAELPMTAVMCSTFLVGRISFLPRKCRVLIPTLCFLAVMGLCEQWDLTPLAALVLGGMVGLLPVEEPLHRRKTAQDYVQARLESLSAVLAQTGQMLHDVPNNPPDEGALMERAAEEACARCIYRQDCPAAERISCLPQTILHQRSITTEDMPPLCMNKERLQAQLQRSQDHYRLLLAERQKQKEYRGAVMQQYGFLSDYLLHLAQELPQREQVVNAVFRPDVACCSRGKRQTNGDRCLRFGVGGDRYYILLCDGMGTGEAAAYEARIAAGQLRRMLCAGYPPLAALRTINSLCALRGVAGAVTMDVAQADLLTGRVMVYKWGAAPSWRLEEDDWEKIGRETPPPGISLEENDPTADRITLNETDALIMLSDGVDAEMALMALEGQHDQPVGFLAALLLEAGAQEVPDDATAVVLRLHRIQG